MKLVIAVVQGADAEPVLDALVEAGFRATQISSAGGYLRESNVTFLIGVDDSDVPTVAQIVERNVSVRKRFVNPLMPFAFLSASSGDDSADEVRVGANVFVVPVRRFVRLNDIE